MLLLILPRHPMYVVRAAAMTYSLANKDEYRELATATSHLTGHTISRFTHVHQDVGDLIKKDNGEHLNRKLRL